MLYRNILNDIEIFCYFWGFPKKILLQERFSVKNSEKNQ